MTDPETIARLTAEPARDDVERVVVPREPTPEMTAVGCSIALDGSISDARVFVNVAWSAMLAAAPKHPTDDLRRTREAEALREALARVEDAAFRRGYEEGAADADEDELDQDASAALYAMGMETARECAPASEQFVQDYRLLTLSTVSKESGA